MEKAKKVNCTRDKSSTTLFTPFPLIEQSYYSLPLPIAIFDCQVRYLGLSKSWIDIYNLKESVIGKSHYEVFPEINDEWKEIHQEALRGAFKHNSCDRFDRQDGSVMYLSWYVCPWYHNNEIGGIIMYSVDITREINTDLELSQTKDILSATLDNMPGLVRCQDSEGRYLFVNDSFCEAFGKNRDTIIGKSDSDIFHNKKQFQQKIQLKSSVTSSLEIEHTNGEKHYYDSYRFPVYGHNKNILSFTEISIDVTKKKEIEEELKLERARFIQASKLASLGEMAGGIAHEINNPLAIIGAYSRQLTKLSEKSNVVPSEKVKVITNEIYTTINRISEIIKGLLDFSRDGSGINFQNTDLLIVINKVSSFFKEKLLKEGIRFEVHCDKNLIFNGNEVHLSQVMFNLLSNAMDAIFENKESGVEIDYFIKIEAKKHGDMISIQVEDNGIEISQEAYERVFDPFFTTKKLGKGTGLGLSVSKGIIETHGGELRLESTRFSKVFEIKIPLVQY